MTQPAKQGQKLENAYEFRERIVMTSDSSDIRLDILKLLRLRDEQSGALPDLDGLEKAFQPSNRKDIRRAIEALEAIGHVNGVHSLDDSNPSYYISERGKLYLYNLEHK